MHELPALRDFAREVIQREVDFLFGIEAPDGEADRIARQAGVTEVVAGQNQMPMLQSNSEKLLTEDAAKYRSIIAAGGFVKVPGFAFKKGGAALVEFDRDVAEGAGRLVFFLPPKVLKDLAI